METKCPKILVSVNARKENYTNADKHCFFKDYDLVHKVKLKGKNFLSEIYGEEFYVNIFIISLLKTLEKIWR